MEDGSSSVSVPVSVRYGTGTIYGTSPVPDYCTKYFVP